MPKSVSGTAPSGVPLTSSELICPICSARHTETMPLDACVYFFECTGCSSVFRPKPGDCCVFCSYGSVPCPPVQMAHAEGEAGGGCCG
jgi:hypothetical protein